jgi:small subunit ribosomal protein S16
MLRIRLQRVGKAKKPFYRVIVSEGTKDTNARALEILGNYNTMTGKDSELVVDGERIKYWISKGAQPTDTMHNILVQNKIIDGKKIDKVSITAKRAKKMEKK